MQFTVCIIMLGNNYNNYTGRIYAKVKMRVKTMNCSCTMFIKKETSM